jgi:hypothetical protein
MLQGWSNIRTQLVLDLVIGEVIARKGLPLLRGTKQSVFRTIGFNFIHKLLRSLQQ